MLLQLDSEIFSRSLTCHSACRSTMVLHLANHFENASLHTLFTSKHLHILILPLIKYLSFRLIVSSQNSKLYHFQITSLYQTYSLLSKSLHFKSLHFQLLHLKILSLPNHLTAKLLHLQILNLTCSLRTSHISNHYPTLLIITALLRLGKL